MGLSPLYLPYTFLSLRLAYSLLKISVFLLHLCIYDYIYNLLHSYLSSYQWYQSNLLFLCFSLHVPNEVMV